MNTIEVRRKTKQAKAAAEDAAQLAAEAIALIERADGTIQLVTAVKALRMIANTRANTQSAEWFRSIAKAALLDMGLKEGRASERRRSKP